MTRGSRSSRRVLALSTSPSVPFPSHVPGTVSASLNTPRCREDTKRFLIPRLGSILSWMTSHLVSGPNRPIRFVLWKKGGYGTVGTSRGRWSGGRWLTLTFDVDGSPTHSTRRAESRSLCV
jgi:hypothetical protein